MNEPSSSPEIRVALFQKREIRRTMHNDEWWFVITDIVAVLTDAANPSDYWKKMRKRDPDLGKVLQGGGQLVPPLALEFATAGGPQKLQCWNTEGILRLIQSMLAEATTTKLHRDRDSQGMTPLKKDAHDGGAVAGRTRKDIEAQTDKPVISAENFKQLSARKSKKLKAAED